MLLAWAADASAGWVIDQTVKGGGDVRQRVAAWRVASEGYPVRTLDPEGGVVEVDRAVSHSVPATEFRPPAGFTRTTFGEMMER